MKIGVRLFAYLLLATLAAAQVPKNWKKFISSQGGYVVSYPKSWHLLLPDLPTLLISSFPPSRRVRAVIVPANGATVSIVPAVAGVKDIEEWIARDNAIIKIKSRNSFTLQRKQVEAPLNIVEVNFESIEGPDTTSWYFELAGRLLVANLSYWRDDPNWENYRGVLRKVAQGIEALPQ